MDNTVVLEGPEEELTSYQALKFLVVAGHASMPIRRRVASLTAMTMVLPNGTIVRPIPRALARLAPGSGLLGFSPEEEAWVDGWTAWATTTLEVPVKALLSTKDAAALREEVTADVGEALAVLDRHLTYRTYLVGNGVTVADLVVACVLDRWYSSSSSSSSTPATTTVNLERWYQTIIHGPAYVKAVKALSNLAGDEAPLSQAVTTTTTISLPGVAPPVEPKLFKRERIRVKEVLQKVPNDDETDVVTVCGWARTLRKANKGALLFVGLTDGSCGTTLQCVLEQNVVGTEILEQCKGCGGSGASFRFVGRVIESPAEGQAVELHVKEAELLGAVYGGPEMSIGGMFYPMAKKAHTLEYLREQAHLRPRSRVHAAAMRIRHSMAYATHKFFHEQGFLYIHTPIITCADCEGAGEQFGVTTLLGTDPATTGLSLPIVQPPEKPLSKKEEKRRAAAAAKAVEKAATSGGRPPDAPPVEGAVDYSGDFFGGRANLTVSGQLNVETHCCALSDVYTFGPTFRAEDSHTSRHLAEFWMIEPEIAFADLARDIDLAEDYLKYCVRYALEACADDLHFFEHETEHGEKGLTARLRQVLQQPFKRLTYTEGMEILQKAVASGEATFEKEPVWGMDLPTEMERYLCETVFAQPVVLMDYPKDIKAFYMKLNDDEKTVAAADVLVPKIGEIIGGSQREHRLDVLRRRCEETGLDPSHVWWYLDLRKYGTVPHAGFGLGFERLCLFVTGLDNIRDVIPFPRWPGNAEF